MSLAVDSLTLAEAARIMREAVKNKSYQLYPLGQDAATYLRAKRRRLTEASYRDYEGCLDKLARHFVDLNVTDFEPPVGTRRLEEFMDATWGDKEPRTYNKNLSIVSDFFKFWVVRGIMHGNPTVPMERAKKRDVHREIFSTEQRLAIIAAQENLRDRIALRLLLDYGLRKGALQGIQFKHFDHTRKRLTIFTKNKRVREIPLVDPLLWLELERHILDVEAMAGHFLMCREKTIPRAGRRRFPDKPLSAHGLHDWWYRCLTRAGVVPEGTTKGEHMHKARHTAGQRILDATGNLKAAQKLLGHESIQTTADIYVDWDIDQLAQTLGQVFSEGTDK